MTHNPQAIAKALDDQAAQIDSLKSKNQALTEEVQPLRSLPKILKETQEKLAAAQQSAHSAQQQQQAAEVRANGLQAELAREQAAKARLEKIVAVVAEKEQAAKTIERHLAGRKS